MSARWHTVGFHSPTRRHITCWFLHRKTLKRLDVYVLAGADLQLWKEDRIPRGEAIYRTQTRRLSEVAFAEHSRSEWKEGKLRGRKWVCSRGNSNSAAASVSRRSPKCQRTEWREPFMTTYYQFWRLLLCYFSRTGAGVSVSVKAITYWSASTVLRLLDLFHGVIIGWFPVVWYSLQAVRRNIRNWAAYTSWAVAHTARSLYLQ